MRRRVPPAPAHVAHLLERRASSTTRCAGTDVIKQARPGRARALRRSPTCGRRSSPRAARTSLEDWVSNRFGKRLYDALLQDLHREGLGRARRPRSAPSGPRSASRACRFFSAAKAAFFGNKGNKIKIADRRVPLPALRPRPDVGDDDRRDRASSAARCASRRRSSGSSSTDGRVVARRAPAARRFEPAAVISSLPLRATVGMAEPAAAGRGASRPRAGLRYRDFLTVALVLDGEDLFPDNWIYIHEPDVRVGRIQNYRSWSPWMVPDPDQGLRRARVLLLRGRRPVDDGRRRARRARHATSSTQLGLADASKVERGYVDARAARPTRCTTPTTPSASTRSATWLDGDRQPPAGRPQRAAPLQQLRPLDADARCARSTTSSRGAEPRHLGGERRERLPRGGDRRPGRSSPTRRCR